MKCDPVLVSSVAQALIAQGWKKPGGRGRFNTDPLEANKRNSPFYKGKKNLIDPDGKSFTCFKCGSIYHFQDKCPKKNDKTNDALVSHSKLRLINSE